MKKSPSFAAGMIASVALALGAATAYAHPQQGQGDGQHARGGMHHMGMQHGGGQHGMQGGMGPGARGQGAAQGGMTAEERTAMQERMRNATTPEERQKIAAANRAEMQKRFGAQTGAGPEQRGTGEHHGRGHGYGGSRSR